MISVIHHTVKHSMELWADIEGYEGRYQISTLGRVKSVARSVPAPQGRMKPLPEIIMRQFVHYKGYMTVWLRRENMSSKHFIHRLVAVHFIPNPDGKPIVNHKDRDKRHNSIHNLEWNTDVENQQHWRALQQANEPF